MELTTKDLTKVFGVGTMTINNWRAHTDKKKNRALPYYTRKIGTGERHRVYFKWGEVKQWAVRNKVKVILHPGKLDKQ